VSPAPDGQWGYTAILDQDLNVVNIRLYDDKAITEVKGVSWAGDAGLAIGDVDQVPSFAVTYWNP